MSRFRGKIFAAAAVISAVVAAEKCTTKTPLLFQAPATLESIKVEGAVDFQITFSKGESYLPFIHVVLMYEAALSGDRSLFSLDEKNTSAVLDLTSLTKSAAPSAGSSLRTSQGKAMHVATALATAALVGQDQPRLGALMGSMGLALCVDGALTCDHSANISVSLPFGICTDGYDRTSQTITFKECPKDTVTIKQVNVNATGEVTVQGIVTADVRFGKRRGFFLQMTKESAAQDITVASEAIFVYCGGGCNSVDASAFKAGDLIQIKGSASIYNGNPQISQTNLSEKNVRVLCLSNQVEIGSSKTFFSCSNLNVVRVELPASSFTSHASYKGMLVSFAQDMFITDTYSLKYGSLGLSSGGVLVSETMVVKPGEDAAKLEAADKLRYIVLDDGDDTKCPVPQIWPVGGTSSVRVGYKIPASALDATAVLNLEFGKWTLIPTKPGLEYISSNIDSSTNPFPTDALKNLPANIETKIRIASANTLNYFTTFQNNCTFSKGCRGATDEEEFKRQQKKLFVVLKNLDAALVGLQEVQNDGSDKTLASLVHDFNAYLGEERYDYIKTRIPDRANGEDTGVDTDAINSAIIYQPNFVTPVGEVVAREFNNPGKLSRATIVQSFNIVGSSEVINFYVNHLKSRGKGCPEDTDPAADVLAGESYCGLTRLEHVRQLLAFVAENPTKQGSDLNMLVGDFNSHYFDRSIQHLVENSYVSLAQRDNVNAYSYSYAGKRATLDYAFASESLSKICTNTTEWHINSDEAILTDYNSEQYFDSDPACGVKPSKYTDENSPARAADHDPIVTICSFEPAK